MAKRILIVEDEVDVARLIKFMLELNDFEVITAYDGEEGLRQAKEQRPDLIILDLKIPKIAGDDVAFELNRDSNTTNIPIIAIADVKPVCIIEDYIPLVN